MTTLRQQFFDATDGDDWRSLAGLVTRLAAAGYWDGAPPEIGDQPSARKEHVLWMVEHLTSPSGASAFARLATPDGEVLYKPAAALTTADRRRLSAYHRAELTRYEGRLPGIP